MDKISVLVTTRNREAFLEEALKSLCSQTHTNWEAVVVDNGSGGQGRQVVVEIGDSRIRYLKSSSNLGECGGRNLAFTQTTGDYLCYLDDDDSLPEDSLRSRLEFLNRHAGCGMIYAEYRRFRVEKGRRLSAPLKVAHPYLTKSYYDRLLEKVGFRQEETFYFLKWFNFVRGGTPLIRRGALERVGLFDDRLKIHGDYEMWLRLCQRFATRFLKQEVYDYRIHEGATQSRVSDKEKTFCAQRICRKYGIRSSLHFGIKLG